MFNTVTNALALSQSGTQNSGGESMADSSESDENGRGNEANALVTSILDGLDDPTIVVDTAGKITHINNQSLDLYECTKAEAVGRKPVALQDKESSASDIVAEALEDGEDIQQRIEEVTVDSELVPVERTVTLLSDESGKFAGAMLVERDISERRRERNKAEFLQQYQSEVIDDLQETLRKLSEGDLTIDPTVPKPEEDYDEAAEIYEEFYLLNDNLSMAVGNIRGVIEVLTEDADDLVDAGEVLSANTEEVTSAIDEIDASSSEMARGADDLAKETQRASQNVDDLSSSIEEITASVQQIDAQSEEVADLAANSVDEASQAVTQIREATDATSTVAKRIDSLEQSMHEVSEIVDIISDIAEQTNMLALNANIEAARAGKAGEGFAVVANEVKNLAEESRTSADDIAEIIENIQDQTEDLVGSIHEANNEVDDGADAVDELVGRLERIDERAEMTSNGLEEISGAVVSQAQNAEQISSVLDDAAGLTEEMTASIQQISGGLDEQAEAMGGVSRRSERLSQMGDEMYDRVDQFKLDDDDTANIEDNL